MTKKVRIENADTSNYKVVVRVFDKAWGENPEKLVEEVVLHSPTDLRDFYIHSGRYITVSEE
jgi:hypothetical protein